MIETARLRLRRARQDDLAPLHAVFSDPRATRYWSRPAHDTLDDTRLILNGLMAPDDSESADFIFDLIGVCIATEALTAILTHAFAERPELDRLTAEVDPRNAASVRVLARLGFVQTGFAEKNFLYGADEWCDTAYLELPRPADQSTGVRR